MAVRPPKINKTSVAVGAAGLVAGIALGAPMLASAQSTPTPSATNSAAPESGAPEAPDGKGGGSGETPVTGAAADSATKAALAATGGGTARRVTTENDGPAGVAYEVHVTKTDGSRVKVLLNKDFGVVATKAHGPEGRDRKGPEKAPLAADVAQKVTDAAKAAVPGGTVGKVSAETRDAAGAAYEAHVTKPDGSRVEVILDKDFKVLTTQAAKGGRG